MLVSSNCVDGVNWSCSGYGYDWSPFSSVKVRNFLGCWRCPSMVDFVLGKYFCTRSNNRPGQEVKKFLWLLFPIHIEWGSSMMCGDNPPVYSLTCTCTRSPQIIRQELWTPSLVYFSGSNLHVQVWAWVSCTFHYNFSTPFFENEDRIAIKGGFKSIIAKCSNVQQGLAEPCKKMFSPCLNRQVLVRK